MDAKAKIDEAKAAAAQNNLELAQRLLKDFLQQDPLNVQAWLAMSDVVGNPNDAMRCLERVLKLQPGNELARQRLNKLRDPFVDLFTTSYSGYEQNVSGLKQTPDPMDAPSDEPHQPEFSFQSEPIQANTYQPRSTNRFEQPQEKTPTPEQPLQGEPAQEELQSQRYQQALAAANIKIEEPQKKSGNCVLISVVLVIMMGLIIAVIYLIVQNPSILNLGSA